MYGKLARSFALALSFATLATSALAADRTVTIGYQTDIEPSKIAQAEGRYEKASGWKINWRKFSTGAEVIAAMASGDVQVGFTGSSPLAAGITRGLPLQTFFIAPRFSLHPRSPCASLSVKWLTRCSSPASM